MGVVVLVTAVAASPVELVRLARCDSDEAVTTCTHLPCSVCQDLDRFLDYPPNEYSSRFNLCCSFAAAERESSAEPLAELCERSRDPNGIEQAAPMTRAVRH